MTTYQTGDLLLVDFPMTTSGPAKPRPALVVLDTGDADVMLARVTTQSRNTPFDVPIADWKKSGLLAPSIVRLHKIATVAKTRVQRVLGRLEASDRQQIRAVLQQIAATW
jgi:mRNA interferase MazF